MCHATANNLNPIYPSFDKDFYKFPSYLRRSEILDAVGKVSSHKSKLAKWENGDPGSRGKKPSHPKAGKTYPCMYKGEMYRRSGEYEAKLKVFARNTWDWITVKLKKSDVDYINRHCKSRKECAPTLTKRGRQWFLDFPFKEKVKLTDKDVTEQTIVAVDLGINTAAAVSVMRSDGTVLGRHFLKLPKEYDSLNHAMNRIKKAQQYGNYKTPRLWASAKGMNKRIAVETAQFVMNIATKYHADVIVFEHLELSGKKRGSKKQKLHMWRSRYVQKMVTDKAHQAGMRIRRICAWNTSRLAYDGSGLVMRGRKAGFKSYSMCQFLSGKIYNCDLNATYNIGARYFIREILKSLPVRVRLELEAKVPRVSKRSTCTLSTLINLNAELASFAM